MLDGSQSKLLEQSMVYPRLGSLRKLAMALILGSGEPRRKSEKWESIITMEKVEVYAVLGFAVTTWDIWILLSTLCQFGLPYNIEMKENIAMRLAYKVQHTLLLSSTIEDSLQTSISDNRL